MGRRSRGRQPPAVFFPGPQLFRRLRVNRPCKGVKFFGRFWASTTVYSPLILITAPPIDSLRLISGGLRCSAFTPFTPFGVTAAEYRSGLFRSKPARLVLSHLRWLPAPTLVWGSFSQRALKPLVNTSGLCQNNDNVRRLPNGQRVEYAPMA